MAVVSDNSATFGGWKKKKEVIVTIYHVDVEDTVTSADNKKRKRNKSRFQHGGTVSSQARRPRKFHAQPLTNNNNSTQRRPFIKHGADRRAEILQWCQEMNKQSRAASIDNITQKNNTSSTDVPAVFKSQEPRCDVYNRKKAQPIRDQKRNNGGMDTAQTLTLRKPVKNPSFKKRKTEDDIKEIAAKPDKSDESLLQPTKNGSANKIHRGKASPKYPNGVLNNLRGVRHIPAILNQGTKERWTSIQSSLCGLCAKSMNATLSPHQILPKNKNKNEKKWRSKIVSEMLRFKRIIQRLV